MRRQYYLNLVIVCLTVVSLCIFAKAVFDDDDVLGDVLPQDGYFHYFEWCKNPLLRPGVLFELGTDTVLPPQIIFYLERQEKSPPANPAVPVVFQTIGLQY